MYLLQDITVEVGRKKFIVKTDRLYTETHEWAIIEGNFVKIGITDYAQKELKDIVGIELPEIGRVLKKGEEIGAIDSVKASSPYYAPVSGKVVSINDKLRDKPELLNIDPYGEGWIAILEPVDPSEIKQLLKPEEYVEVIKRAVKKS